MGNTVTKAAALDFGIQFCGWVLASALKTEKFYDLTGSSTNFILALQSLRWGGTYFMRQKVLTGMTMVWAARLGLYLFGRVLHDGADRRFNHVRDRPGRFFIFWAIQGVWVFCTLLPVLLVNQKKKDRKLTGKDYAGWALWSLGFLLEVVADFQKSRFRANPDKVGKFITHGLWSISQHPNYLGEILMWIGIYLSSSSVCSGWEHIGAISPILTTILLTKVSGIPLLEAHGLKRWGTDPAYQEYIRNTAKLVPFVW